ncbi:MAG: hypothetical protein R2820_04850 [Cyclobacteriaceae bacterium]|nr:hypothetical protein [Cyclobacteriaceae bacterium]
MKIWYILSLVFLSQILFAQRISVGLEGYLGASRMSSLRTAFDFPEGYPIEYKTLQNFPMRPGIRVTTSIRPFDSFSTGIIFGFLSTGSRLSYGDNTGGENRDVIASGIHVGSCNRFTLINRGPWSFHVRLNIGAVFNSVEFKNHVSLYFFGLESTTSSKWKSINLFNDTGIEIGHTIERFYIKGLLSYEIGSNGKPKLKEETGPMTIQEFDVQWDGLRIGIGMEYRLFKGINND